jgi:hypothetical protein
LDVDKDTKSRKSGIFILLFGGGCAKIKISLDKKAKIGPKGMKKGRKRTRKWFIWG